MSNSLLQDPIILTQAMTGTYKTLSGLVDLALRIERVLWVGPVSPGDTFTIVDANGYVLLSRTCSVAHQDVDTDFNANPELWRDFQLSQISSGTLYIYLR